MLGSHYRSSWKRLFSVHKNSEEQTLSTKIAENIIKNGKKNKFNKKESFDLNFEFASNWFM